MEIGILVAILKFGPQPNPHGVFTEHEKVTIKVGDCEAVFLLTNYQGKWHRGHNFSYGSGGSGCYPSISQRYFEFSKTQELMSLTRQAAQFFASVLVDQSSCTSKKSKDSALKIILELKKYADSLYSSR